jgi:hypothetical protein
MMVFASHDSLDPESSFIRMLDSLGRLKNGRQGRLIARSSFQFSSTRRHYLPEGEKHIGSDPKVPRSEHYAGVALAPMMHPKTGTES